MAIPIRAPPDRRRHPRGNPQGQSAGGNFREEGLMKPAEIILEQLGGRRFVKMTGASLLMDGGTYLSFRLPGKNFCKQDINYVRIELTPMDVYNMVFCRIRGDKV